MAKYSKYMLGVLVTLAIVSCFAPSGAKAASGFARCPAGYFCLFSGYNGTGTIAYFHIGSPDLRQQHLDNAASSVWNRSGRPVREFVGYNYTSYWACSFIGTKGNIAPHWQDAFSSVRVGSCG